MTDNFLPFDMAIMAPAIDIGKEHALSTFNVDFDLKMYNYSTDCDGTFVQAVGQFSRAYFTEGVKSFIGPACSQGVESTGYLAEYLNVPVVTGVGDLLLRDFTSKKIYATTTVLSYSIQRFSGM